MKKSIVRKIIMIFIFMGILPMMLFNYIYIIDSEKNNREEIRESLEKLAGEKSQVLGLTFKQIENEVDNIGSWMDFYKENELSDEDIKKYLESIDVEYDENLNKVINSEKLINYFQDEERYSSNIYIPDHDNIYFYTVKDILNTYFAEKYLSQVSRTLSNIGIGWSYIITKNNVLRIYPYTSMETFEKNHSFEKDIYYWIAAEQDNPEREIRWTVPYVDWCGTGWVITCSRPVYHNDEFYGVVSIDVPLEKINSTVYDFQIQDSGFAFLVDNKGNAIHHPEAMEKNKDKGEPLSINLLSNSKDKNFLGIIEKMMNGEKGFEIYEDISTGRSKAVAYSNIVNPKWSVGIEVDWDDYLEVNYGYSKYLIMIMVPVIILISISGIYFFRRISMPIKILANNVKMLEPGKTREIVKFDREDEIGVLSQAFTKMYESINKYTEDIIRKNLEIEAVFNSFPGILYIIDNNYNIKLLNYKGLEVLNKNGMEKYKYKSLKCYEEFFQRSSPCKECPKNVYNSSFETNFSDIAYKKRLFRINAHPIYETKGTINEWVIYNTEITEQFMLENSIAQSKKMASVGEIVAGITHELKNPIGVIKGANYLINEFLNSDEGIDRNEMMELVVQINESVEYSENTISNLLDFSKVALKSDKKVNIIKIIDQIIILDMNNIIKKGITILKSYEEKDLFVKGNIDSMKHIFLNIISNGIDTVPKEKGILEISFEKGYEEVIISVKDNGEGIDDSIIDSIFEPFVTTKGSEGHGLGLWIVKNELEKMGGEIKVEKVFPSGSNFLIYLRT